MYCTVKIMYCTVKIMYCDVGGIKDYPEGQYVSQRCNLIQPKVL